MATIPAGTWAIDAGHSSAGWAVKHFGVSTFRGKFPGVSGAVETADGAVTAITGEVQIDSLRTEDEQQTGHLKSPDFFDVTNHPTGTFRSTAVQDRGDGTLAVTGDLTLRGVTKPVELDVEVEGVGPDAYGNTRIGLAATGVVDRTDFGISWNMPLEGGGLTVGERVKLEWNIEAIKAEQ
jgi:polyisoprenoid-binding protein YceI